MGSAAARWRGEPCKSCKDTALHPQRWPEHGMLSFPCVRFSLLCQCVKYEFNFCCTHLHVFVVTFNGRTYLSFRQLFGEMQRGLTAACAAAVVVAVAAAVAAAATAVAS